MVIIETIRTLNKLIHFQQIDFNIMKKPNEINMKITGKKQVIKILKMKSL